MNRVFAFGLSCGVKLHKYNYDMNTHSIECPETAGTVRCKVKTPAEEHTRFSIEILHSLSVIAAGRSFYTIVSLL